MILGIDIGGTYTDTVVLHNGKIVLANKIPTTDNLVECITNALEKVLKKISANQIKRLVISTTMLTNIVSQNRLDKVGVIIIPGPGINPERYEFPTATSIIKGAINYRGHEIEPLDMDELEKNICQLNQQGYTRLAVIGKFSGRNALHELMISEYINDRYPDTEVTLGHQVSSYLNFPRRCATTWLTAATKNAYENFIQQINYVLEKYNISCPVYIMKADGGVIPIQAADHLPAETVYSGPAASTVGAAALTGESQSAVVMDIGGTTTDLSLVLSGVPLTASKGLIIKELMTHVKSLAMRAVPLGGDFPIQIQNNHPVLVNQRQGKAACFGGHIPTFTDALNIIDGIPGLNVEESRRAFINVLKIEQEKLDQFAEEVICLGVDIIANEIRKMINDWQDEPAYRIWEVLEQDAKFPNMLVGIGGAAQGITERVAQALNMQPIIPPYARVANAIGCAVAKPTLTFKLHIDTAQKMLSLVDEGIQKPFNDLITEEKAITLAKEYLIIRAKKLGIIIEESDIEVVYSELFTVIRGYSRVGEIIDVEVQIKPGLVTRIEEEKNHD